MKVHLHDRIIYEQTLTLQFHVGMRTLLAMCRTAPANQSNLPFDGDDWKQFVISAAAAIPR